MKRIILFIILIVAVTIFSGCINRDRIDRSQNPSSSSINGMSNPAAIYCQDLGYEFSTVAVESGEKGVCILPDASECDAWDFLVGKCGVDFSFCSQQGYGTKLVEEPGDASSGVIPVCVDEDQQEVGKAHELMGLYDKSLGCESNLDAAQPPDQAVVEYAEPLDFIPPPSFDWRSYLGGDWLTPIKNQADCGSCWAFAAVAVAESVINISRNDPTEDLNLSEQYMVADCYQEYDGYGSCCGGRKNTALEYIIDSGIPDDSCFPYDEDGGCYPCVDQPYPTPPACSGGCNYDTGGSCSDSTCSERCPDWDTRLVNISEVGYVGSDPATIKQYLVDYGPLAVSMRVEGMTWTPGSDPYTCVGSTTNHAVVIVGYDDAGGYWIVRNSWGTGWGDGGYFHLGYGECGIESYVYAAYNNDPPNTPDSPGPGDLETNVSIRPELSWVGGDLNPGDVITYDVYLEAGNPSPSMLVCDDTAAELCNPGTLLENTTYYWQVVTWDDYGQDTAGPVWAFTTEHVTDHTGFYVPSKYRWYLKNDRTDGWSGVTSFGWGGVSELIPVVGDWDGDSVDTPGFYKPSQYKWFLKNDHTDGWAGVTNFNWGGGSELVPIVGDWDGDGDDTVGFYKPSASEWYLKDDNTAGWSGFTMVVFGGATENIPVVGDWDGDGVDTIGFFVPSQNKWWLKNDLVDGWAGVSGFNFGTADPMDPVTGDWDGDGIDTVGGYVATKWRWYLKDDQVSGWSNVSNFKFGVTVDYDQVAGDWQ
jgi:putative hemolysin